MVGLSRKRVFPKTKGDSITGQDILPFMRVLRSSCSYFTFIYCHFHFLLSFGTRTLIRFLSFSFPKLRKEILRCTFPLKKVIWRVIKSIHICNCQKQYLNSLFPPKLPKEAHKKMSFIETNLEHWPFRRHCLHLTSRSNLGRNRQFCLFVCFTSQVNSYGHCGTVSSPNHTFSWAGLNKRLTSNSCTYFRL